MLRNFHDITNVLFINLDSRTDRRTHFESQFFKIGFHPQRFAAIQKARGAIGCSMSHIACMEMAIKKNGTTFSYAKTMPQSSIQLSSFTK